MNIDAVGKFYLGNGGIGDALLFLSTFYDECEEANVIFLANEPNSIVELFNLFPKLRKKLILQNSWTFLQDLYNHPNCIGTGILPKNLDYSTWYKVDIFKEYGVKEFPKFVELFEPNHKYDLQLFYHQEGSRVEGTQKQRILTEETQNIITNEFSDHNFVSIKQTLKETFELIKGSDVVVGVDSFVKTFSAMCGIRTIVYDNVYHPSYLARFRDNIDYGHYVFLFPWSKIEFRSQ